MAAAPDGTTVITVPHTDGTVTTVTLRHDPDTGEFAQPWAITVDGAAADIQLHTAADSDAALFTCAPGAHITAAMLADAGIRTAADIHALTVTAPRQ